MAGDQQDQAVQGLQDRGVRWCMDHLSIVPAPAGVNPQAGLVLLVCGRSVGAFYVDRGPDSTVTVLVSTRHGPVLIAGIRGANQLAGSVALDPRLSDEEVGEVFADLRHSRVGP